MTADETAGPDPNVLAEDLEDLKANSQAFASQLEDAVNTIRSQAEQISALQAALDATEGGNGDGQDQDGGDAEGPGKGGKGKSGKEKEPPAPPLIVKLAGQAYDAELSQLGFWVKHLLAPTFLKEVSSGSPWCRRWFEHEEAVARLHALWLAWQECTTPEAGGYTGPSVWMRDHLRPCMDELRAPDGPFAACATHEDSTTHALLPTPPVDEPPYVPPPTPADAGDADDQDRDDE